MPRKHPDFDVPRYLALAEIVLTERQFLIWKLSYTDHLTIYQIREAHGWPARTIERERERALAIMESEVYDDQLGTRPFRITLVCGGDPMTRDDRTPLGKGVPCSWPDLRAA